MEARSDGISEASTRTDVPGGALHELFLALEEVEAAYWCDLYEAGARGTGPAAELHYLGVGSGKAFVAPGSDVLALNKVVGLGLREDALRKDLAWMIHAYQEAGVARFFVQVSPAAGPQELYAWLETDGFRHYNNWMKLVRPLDAAVPEVRTDVRVEALDARGALVFGEMVVPSFNWPAWMVSSVASTVGLPGWYHYAAYDGDEPVACAGLFVREGYAYFGPAVTLEPHRGRGAQSALIARRLRDAASMGCHTAITDTAEDRPEKPSPSFRNMRRMGFAVAYPRPNYLFTV